MINCMQSATATVDNFIYFSFDEQIARERGERERYLYLCISKALTQIRLCHCLLYSARARRTAHFVYSLRWLWCYRTWIWNSMKLNCKQTFSCGVCGHHEQILFCTCAHAGSFTSIQMMIFNDIVRSGDTACICGCRLCSRCGSESHSICCYYYSIVCQNRRIEFYLHKLRRWNVKFFHRVCWVWARVSDVRVRAHAFKFIGVDTVIHCNVNAMPHRCDVGIYYVQKIKTHT